MHPFIITLLTQANTLHKIHHHAPMRTTADIRTLALFPLGACLKSIPFGIKGGGWALATLLAEDQVDYKKLAALLGVRRENLLRPSPDDMQAVFGVEPGTVTPFATTSQPCVVFIDSKAAALNTVYCGTGEAGATLEIGVLDLISITGALAAELAK